MNPKNNLGMIYGIIGIACILVFSIAAYVIFQNMTATPMAVNTNETSTTAVSNITNTTNTTNQEAAPLTKQQKLDALFDIRSKKAETKLFYSEKLGVGFTYLPYSEYNPSVEVMVTEKGDTIYVHDAKYEPETGQSIQVFTKDEKLTLEEAMTDRFLKDYKKTDCFATADSRTDFMPNGYTAAVISFSEELAAKDGPWWDIGDKCPVGYTATNGIQYFVMNSAVPGKFLFLKLGQDSMARDGSIVEDGKEFHDWSYSLQIVE